MRTGNSASGLVFAVLAAFAFGIGGPFVRPLLEAGWTSSAAVLCRCAGTLLVLLVPAILRLRGRWGILRRNWRTLLAYGVFAVVGTQLLYYSAITRMPVGAALLIEYLAPVLLVGWSWLRTRRRPGGRVLAGSALAIAGLLLVVDLGGAGGVDPVGPILALSAAVVSPNRLAICSPRALSAAKSRFFRYLSSFRLLSLFLLPGSATYGRWANAGSG